MSSFFARRYQTVQDIKPLSVEEILQLNPKDVKTNPILDDANFKRIYLANNRKHLEHLLLTKEQKFQLQRLLYAIT